MGVTTSHWPDGKLTSEFRRCFSLDCSLLPASCHGVSARTNDATRADVSPHQRCRGASSTHKKCHRQSGGKEREMNRCFLVAPSCISNMLRICLKPTLFRAEIAGSQHIRRHPTPPDMVHHIRSGGSAHQTQPGRSQSQCRTDRRGLLAPSVHTCRRPDDQPR